MSKSAKISEGRPPCRPKIDLGTGRSPSLRLPFQDVYFALIWPIFRLFNKAGSNWVFENILPFLLVIFASPHLRIPEMPLSDGRLFRSRPTSWSGWRIAARSMTIIGAAVSAARADRLLDTRLPHASPRGAACTALSAAAPRSAARFFAWLDRGLHNLRPPLRGGLCSSHGQPVSARARSSDVTSSLRSGIVRRLEARC